MIIEGINQASSDVKAYNNGAEQRDDKLPRFCAAICDVLRR